MMVDGKLIPSETLRGGCDVIRAPAARHRTSNPQVFEILIAGRDGADSDPDLSVETTPETTLST